MTLSQYLANLGHGAIAELAMKLNVTPQAVSSWNKGKKISVERAIQIWFTTKGEVGLHEMCPDIFPPKYVLTHISNLKQKEKQNV